MSQRVVEGSRVAASGRSRRFARRGREGLICLLLLAFTSACPSKPQDDATGAVPVNGALPALELNDDTPGLLLTWVDEKGDFHVVQKTSEVPEAGRKQVRVVKAGSDVGTGSHFYVADLTRRGPGNHYVVTTMSRSAWDEIGAAKRRARMEALAPTASASVATTDSAAPADPSGSGAPPSRPKAAAAKAITAVIYGAEWCGPCHSAERYLKSQGVKVVMKDIDQSDVARAEMNQKLSRAGMGTASIPIIDLGGRLLVGFSPAALSRAIEAARNTQAL